MTHSVSHALAIGLAHASANAISAAAFHDGISYDARVMPEFGGRVVIKAPGQPAQVGKLTDHFTFTRNSPATYRGPDGLLRYDNHNLLLQSQTFENAAWGKTHLSIGVNAATAPDGSLTADKLIEDNVASQTHFCGQILTIPAGLTHTASIYAKAAERTVIDVYYGKSGTPFTRGGMRVNLTDGSFVPVDVATPASVTNRSVTPVGNGWYRISLAVLIDNATTDGYLECRMTDGTSTTYTGDGTSGVHLWGAQIQRGRSVGAYLATTAAAKFDQPRVEYDASGNVLGLLIESARTNLIFPSESVGGGGWANLNILSVAADSLASPAGEVTADKLVEDTTNGAHRTRPADITIGANAPCTLSCFFSPGGRTKCSLRVSDTPFANYFEAHYDLALAAVISTFVVGTATSATATITPFANGWYRCTLSGQINNGVTTARPFIEINDNLGNTTYVGDGTSGLYVWGAQFEAGLFATSYVATSAGSASRAGEICARANGSEYGSSSGTARATGVTSGGQDSSFSQFVWNYDDLTGNNRLGVTCRAVGSDLMGLRCFVGGVTQAACDFTITSRSTFKSAGAWTANDFAHTINGQSPVTDNSGSLPAVAALHLGISAPAGSNQMNGHIGSFDYWPIRFANHLLQAITY